MPSELIDSMVSARAYLAVEKSHNTRKGYAADWIGHSCMAAGLRAHSAASFVGHPVTVMRWKRASGFKPCRPVAKSVGRPPAGGAQPLAHLKACFRLARFSKESLPVDAGRHCLRLAPEASGLLGKPLFEGCRLLDTSTFLHVLTHAELRKATAAGKYNVSLDEVISFDNQRLWSARLSALGTVSGQTEPIWAIPNPFRLVLPRKFAFPKKQLPSSDPVVIPG